MIEHYMNWSDFQFLSAIVFNPKYRGYKPNVIESPNGDEVYDEGKIYAHVNHDYINSSNHYLTKVQIESLKEVLKLLHMEATRIAIEIGIPRHLWPSERYSTLRVLEYPPGATTASHTDMSLFTLNCFRNIDTVEYVIKTEGNRPWHFGAMLELINPNKSADPHRVSKKMTSTQYSIVYFAIPDHNAKLTETHTVGEWLTERLNRSRKEK